MLKVKKLVSVVLSIGMLLSISTLAFAEVPNNIATTNASPQAETASEGNSIMPYSIGSATGTNTLYWDSHDVKFTFTAYADVLYNSSTGQYTMQNVYSSRPQITVRIGSGTNAVITEPIITWTDGGRVAVLTSTATITNNTGFTEDKKVRMFLYCNRNNGALDLNEY